MFVFSNNNNNNNNDLYLYRLSLSVLICFVQGLRPATIIERKINMAHILDHIHGKLPLSLPLPWIWLSMSVIYVNDGRMS